MDTKEAYQLEELKLKVAQEQKEANTLLLKAKEKELQLECLRLCENEEIAELHNYLLNLNFGGEFKKLENLKTEKNINEIIDVLTVFTGYVENYGASIPFRLKEGRDLEVSNLGINIARKFYTKYNRFLSLGHPGYDLNKTEFSWLFLKSDSKLFLFNESQRDFEQNIKSLFEEVGKVLVNIYNADKERKLKIAEAKKILAENS